MTSRKGVGGRKISNEWTWMTSSINPKESDSSPCRFCAKEIEHFGELRKMRSHVNNCQSYQALQR